MDEVADPAGDDHTCAHEDDGDEDLHPVIDKYMIILSVNSGEKNPCRSYC